eukprot:5932989-Amphidinium_carterae.1
MVEFFFIGADHPRVVCPRGCGVVAQLLHLGLFPFTETLEKAWWRHEQSVSSLVSKASSISTVGLNPRAQVTSSFHVIGVHVAGLPRSCLFGGVKALRRAMVSKFASTLAAWRVAFDPYGCGRVHYLQFCRAVEEIS